MVKKVIAVDMDEVLLPTAATMMGWFNEKFHTNHTIDKLRTYNFWEVWGVDMDNNIKIWMEFANSKTAASILPDPEAVDAIQLLKKHHSLSIVTSREAVLEARTIKWLNQHFPDCFDQVLFSNHFGTSGQKYTKSELCRQIKAELIIDDSAAFATQCAQEGIDVILFGDYPWNQNIAGHPKITRINDWPSVVKHVIN